MRRVVTSFRAQGTTDEATTRGGEFWRILKYYEKKTVLGFTVFFSILAGCLPLLMNVFMGDFATTITTKKDFMDDLVQVIYKLIGFAVSMVCAMGLNFGFRAFANPYFMLDLRSDVYRAFMEKDVSYYDQTETGVLVGRLSQDITMVHEIFIDKVLNVIMNLSQAFGGVILALVRFWRIALPCVVIILLCGVIFLIGDRIVDKIWVEYNESSCAASSKAEEAITSFRTIKSFNNEEYEASLFKQTLKEVDAVFDKTSLVQGAKNGLIAFCTVA